MTLCYAPPDAHGLLLNVITDIRWYSLLMFGFGVAVATIAMLAARRR